jgi:ComF family protein
MRFKDSLLRLIFPQVRCLACDEPRMIDEGSALCDHCAAEIISLRIRDGICPHCLSPLYGGGPCRYCLQGGMKYLAAAYAPYRYHGIVQRLVVQLKFNGICLAGVPLAEGMLDCLDGRHFDYMMPVPLHRSRLRQRGFNQSALLCERMGMTSGLKTINALERSRNTKRQSSLPHEKRQSNVKDSFKVVLPVEHLSILLVDDVRTSGHTARACAEVLMKAGAKDVCLLTASIAATYSPLSASPVASA